MPSDAMRFGISGDEINNYVHFPNNYGSGGWTPEYFATQPTYRSFDNDEGLPMTKDQWHIMDDVEALLKIKKFKGLSRRINPQRVSKPFEG